LVSSSVAWAAGPKDKADEAAPEPADVDMTKEDESAAEPAPEPEKKAVVVETKTEPTDEAKGAQRPVGLADVRTEKSPFLWAPFGFLRMQYIAVQNDPNVEHVGRDDGFEIQNARIGVRGSYAHRARFMFSIDGAVDDRVQNSPQGRLRVGLRDAFADAFLSDKVFLRVGFFQTWADPQRLVADTDRELVDRPLSIRGVRSTEGWYTPGLPPGRSIGAAFRIEPENTGGVGFEVALQNGADEFSSNNDNDLPAVSGAALLRLADNGFLVAGLRYNPRTVGELPFRQDETDFQGSVGVQINTPVIRIAGGGIVQRTTFASTNGPVQNAFGAHAQLAFHIPASVPVWVAYRFAILDPSSLILTDRVIEHTAGGFLGLPDLRMRIQLQLTHAQEQSARELSNSRIQVAWEVTL
jgi:hypothetical protein